MSLVDIKPSPTGHEPMHGRPRSPDFRQELEKLAPELVEKFDFISRSREEELQEYGRMYHEEKAKNIEKQQAASLSSRSGGREGSHKYTNPGSGSSNRLSDGEVNTSPVTNTDSTKASAQFGQKPQTVRSKNRNLLSSSKGSGSSAGFERPKVVVQSKHRTALTYSPISNGEQGSDWSPKARRPITANDAILTIKIQIRLLPVVRLLTTSDLTSATRSQARDLAHAALDYAKECNASQSLAARCAFYIAHTYYDRDDNTTLLEAVTWFERATEASEADYPEGQWAHEWLNRYQSVNIAADSRPSTANSWFASRIIEGVWGILKGSKSNVTGSAPVSPSAPKPRPNSLRHLYTDGSNLSVAQKRAPGERIPSFSSGDITSASPDSGTSSGTQDFHGLKWSPRSLWGKGEVVKGQRFERVQSPEPIHEVDEDQDEDEEQHIPANVLGGLVEVDALSPAMQRSRYRPPRVWRDSELIVPDYMMTRTWHIRNATSPPDSPSASSPLAEPETKKPSPVTSNPSYFAPASRPHARAQSLAYPPSQRVISDSDHAQSERTQSLPARKRNSLSIAIARATGLDIYREKDEAARMEEGESPRFAPKKEEGGLYQRRSNDIIEKEEV